MSARDRGEARPEGWPLGGRSLTRRGQALLTLAAAFVVTGIAADLAVLVLWGALPAALVILDGVWTRHALAHLATSRLRLEWERAPGLTASATVGAPVSLTLIVSGSFSRSARGLAFTPVGSSALVFLPERAELEAPERPERPELTERPELQGSIAFSSLASRVGLWHIHGVWISFASLLGVHSGRLYRPVETIVRAYPRPLPKSLARPFPATRASAQEGVDRAHQQRPGVGSELRELRDHVPGDPFKHIAWKATARSGRLIVRDFEPELSLSVYVLLDLSPSMRLGPRGATALDRSVNAAYSLAERLVRSRDRVGLLTFATETLSFRRAATGRRALAGVVHDLLRVHHAVHEDLTAVTYGELLLIVAGFLDRQYGTALMPSPSAAGTGDLPSPDAVLAQVRSRLGDAEVSPRGLLDSGASSARVHNGREGLGERGTEQSVDSALLRLFCLQHGVELPLRPTCSPAERSLGYLAAFERIVQAGGGGAGGGGHVLLVLTSLDSVGAPDQLVRAVRLARAHRDHVVFLYASADSVRDSDSGRGGQGHDDRLTSALRDLYGDEARRQARSTADVLRGAGAAVLSLDDIGRLPQLMRKLRRLA